MFCEYCGKEVREEAVFCEWCGKQLQEIAAPTIQDANTSCSDIVEGQTAKEEKKSKILSTALKFAAVGASVAGAIASNNASHAANALRIASQGSMSDLQRKIYGPTAREIAGLMGAEAREAEGQSAKIISSAISGILSSIVKGL